MESIKSYSKPKLRKSHSFLLQKTKSLFTECKDISEAQNNSMKSKNDQSTSTSTDEKSQNTLKKNFSYNKIKSLKDNENKLINMISLIIPIITKKNIKRIFLMHFLII